MVDLLDEARQAVQQERLLAMVKKYGSLIILCTVALIVLVVGWQMWRSAQRKAQYEASVSYFEALNKLQAGNQQEGEAMLAALAEDAPAGYRDIARLQLAAQKVEAGKTEEAMVIYKEVEEDGDSSAFRELAALLRAQLSGEDISTTKGVWRFSALELQGLRNMEAKEYAKARESFTKISTDPLTPQGLRQRAADLLLYTKYLEENTQ